MTWKYSKNFEPFYYQIQKEILHDVEQKKYHPGDQLPSKKEISEKYGVSVITANRVLKNLIDLGIAYSIKGKGTFLAKPFSLDTTGWSFTEQMLLLGLHPSSQVIQFEVRKPEQEVSSKLQIPADEDVYYIKRVRLANKDPLGVELSIIPVKLCPRLIEHNLEKESLFKIIREEYGLEAVWGDAEIFTGTATEDEADCLQIPRNSPVIKQKRIHFTEDFTPFEFLHSTFQSKSRFMFLSGRFRMATAY